MKLISGMVGQVSLFPAKNIVAFLLPSESVLDANGSRGFVFTINEKGIAKRSEVEILKIMDNGIVVNSGIEEGEKIAGLGAAYLTEGKAVLIED